MNLTKHLLTRRLASRVVLLVVTAISFFATGAQTYALSKQDVDAINGTWVNWVTDSGNCAVGVGSSGVSTSAPSQDQVAIAKIVIGIAKTDNLGQQGALIGLMVGLAESGLTIYANSNVPVSLDNPAKQAVGHDHDSVGVFQQRPSTGWSTIATGDAALTNRDAVWQLMNPAYSAEAFFGSPPGANAPSALSKGLQNVDGWQTMEPARAAQKVQASGDSSGSNYQRQQAAAQDLLTKYWDSAPPVALPVSITTVSGSGGLSSLTGSCQTATTGDGNYINPFADPAWGLARTDQGVDYIPAKPLPVLAIGNGVILSTNTPGWPPAGQFILYKLSDGSFAGKCIFVAENLIGILPVGTQIKAGQTIATALPAYPFTEWGWAQGPGTPSTPYNGLPDGTATEGGKAFARFLRSLGANTQQDPGPGPLYTGESCQ